MMRAKLIDMPTFLVIHRRAVVFERRSWWHTRSMSNAAGSPWDARVALDSGLGNRSQCARHAIPKDALPAYPNRLSAHDDPRLPPPAANRLSMPGRRTILVVDDEPMVREIAAEHLAEHGYSVLSAADGYEALPLVLEHPIDVLFTDVVMPGLSGFELANRAKLIRPELGIVYATGYGYSAAGRDSPRYGHVLQKPYRVHELLAEIEHALPESKETDTRIDTP